MQYLHVPSVSRLSVRIDASPRSVPSRRAMLTRVLGLVTLAGLSLMGAPQPGGDECQ
jgi:hypothetical protein